MTTAAPLKTLLTLLMTSRISLAGAVLVTSALGADVLLIVGEVLISESNPYIGIVAYVVFPGIAFLGLLLIPLGALLKLRRLKRGRPIERLLRQLTRGQVFRVIGTLTLVNFVIFAFAGYRSFHLMESPEFCGQVCHEVMSPEFTVHKLSPHSGISCVECHIGSGVGPLIKSKLDGTRQLAEVVLGNYSRPIPTPVHNLRPADEICEECHKVETLSSSRIKIMQSFQPDEYNTATYTVLNMRLGGSSNTAVPTKGIHWHANHDHEIRFWTKDHRRENVYKVELTSVDGSKTVWTRPDVDTSSLEHAEPRLMDCVDCHNRPTHIYLPPETAIDQAIADGRIDISIPWIRSIGLEVLTDDYESSEQAMEAIAKLPDLYSARYPDYGSEFAGAIKAVVPVLQDLHETFVYPEMNIQWNTYPSLIGHPTAHTAACFRCHDGLMVNEKGKTITNDCRACHFVLADHEQDPIILRVIEDR